MSYFDHDQSIHLSARGPSLIGCTHMHARDECHLNPARCHSSLCSDPVSCMVQRDTEKGKQAPKPWPDLWQRKCGSEATCKGAKGSSQALGEGGRGGRGGFTIPMGQKVVTWLQWWDKTYSGYMRGLKTRSARFSDGLTGAVGKAPSMAITVLA